MQIFMLCFWAIQFPNVSIELIEVAGFCDFLGNEDFPLLFIFHFSILFKNLVSNFTFKTLKVMMNNHVPIFVFSSNLFVSVTLTLLFLNFKS